MRTNLLLAITGLLTVAASAPAISVTEYMNLTTLGEASTSALTTMSSSQATPSGQMLPWSGTYSDTQWTYSSSAQFDGMPLILTYSGNLSGSFGQDIVVAFTGTGSWGASPLTIQGKSTWYFDPVLNDYARMDFEQLTEIGAHSIWGWVVGAEVIIGGTIGAAGGIIAGAPATPGGSVVVGTAGALGGAGAAGTLSQLGRDFFIGDPAPPKPGTPNPPGYPTPGGDIFPSESSMNSATSPDGRFLATNGNIIQERGSFANGSISGTIFVVPEPGTRLLVLLGVGVVAFSGVRRLRSQRV